VEVFDAATDGNGGGLIVHALFDSPLLNMYYEKQLSDVLRVPPAISSAHGSPRSL